jgi:capsular exopolysaccharide synthesis family protein
MSATKLHEDFLDIADPDNKEGGESAKGFSVDYHRLWETTKKYMWLIILYMIAAVVAAVVYLSTATPIYESVARIKVEQRVMDTMSLTGSNMEEDLSGLEMLQTIQMSFVSRSLMHRMIDRMNLKNRPDFAKSTGLEKITDDEAFTEYLLGNTKAQLIQGTRLMTIAFDHPDPHVAQDMVDNLIREYIALEGEQRLQAASVNLSYLIEEKKSIEEKLKQSEEKLSQYTKKLGSISVDNELNIIAGQLVDLNNRLSQAKADRLKIESDDKQVAKFRDDPKTLLEIASVQQLPEIASLRSQINTLDGEISKTRSIYGDRNPQYLQLQDQRVTLQKALYAEALRAPDTLDRSYQAALDNEQALLRETNSQEQKAIDTKDLAIQSKVLQREIDADNLAFQAVLTKLNEETSQARSQPMYIEVVDPASPAFKIKPKPVQVIAIAVVLGLVCSALTIFVLTSLDTSFKSVDELETALGLQVLAAVPMYMPLGKEKKKTEDDGALESLPVIEDPYSAASEAYRTLRASLLLLEDESHSILITSAVPEEGKSTTSLSLAITMAQRGARTLLIEADLRKPVLGRRLFKRQDQLGVADFLDDRADFDEIVQRSSVDNLSVIVAGQVNKNSGDLLLRRPRVEKLLALARQNFDQVIVDSAPLLAVSDTLTIARQFKVINLVVRSHKTPRRLVKRAMDILKRAKRTPSGVTMSMVPPGNEYYYYGYNERGKAYGADTPTSPALKS